MKYIAGWFRLCVATVLVVLIVASMLTHDVDDPSMNSASTFQDSVTTKNAIGNVGAYFSDFIMQLLGIASVIPMASLLLSFQDSPRLVRKTYIPCVFMVTFSFAGICSKLSLNMTSWIYHGGIIGAKFEAAFSLSMLIVMAIVGVFGSVGWRASLFLSRALIKVLSEISLWTSACRIRRNKGHVIMGTGRLSNFKREHGVFENVPGESSPNTLNHGILYGAAREAVMHSKLDDKPNGNRCVEAKHVSVLITPQSYKYEERRTGGETSCRGIVSESVSSAQTPEYNTSARNVEMLHGENDGVIQCSHTYGATTMENLEENSNGEPRIVSSSDGSSSATSLYGGDKSSAELYDVKCSNRRDNSFCERELGQQLGRNFHMCAPVARNNHEVHSGIPHVSNETQSFILPHVDLLKSRAIATAARSVEGCAYKDESEELYSVLKDFGVHGKIIDVRYGPVVTLYEFEPSAGTKSSRIIGLADDIARSMSALSTRISVVPGRNVLGIELPNRNREMVVLRDLLCSKEYVDPGLRLPIILGKGIDGDPVVGDLTKMPHLLIAGTTGSGKSVGINTMILSLLYRLTPEQCRMIMIDPKVLELSVYDNIPHLLTPVVTEPKKAVAVLKWVVAEMEERYRLMSAVGVRNITGYNEKVAELANGGIEIGQGSEKYELYDPQRVKYTLPYIVVVVDEMADLMIVSGKEIESSIQRLSQMARAAGIHIIMATQRPSVDVITGVIKANFPTRISFSVTSKVDSRTILGEQGAEQLLGMGDMLYMVAGGKIRRIHGAFVSDSEVQDVANHLRGQCGPGYVEDIAKVLDSGEEMYLEDVDERDDALYEKAVSIVLRDRKTSVSYVQRQLRIGYNRAANLVERMEREGIITAAGSLGKREIVGS